MHTVQECGISAHFRREGVKQAGCLQQYIHALIDVANKDHGGGGSLFFLATSKGTGSHVVLHNLDAVLILETDAGNLIEGNTVPQTYQTNCLATHIVE